MSKQNLKTIPVNDETALQPIINDYAVNLNTALQNFDWAPVHEMAAAMRECWKQGRQVFFCGNGGSGANALHMANDFLYGINKDEGPGMRCQALAANPSILTCLGNDIGYENIFSYQLSVQAQKGDMLIVLSGSGNSPNILNALKQAKDIGIASYAILGYSGGKAKTMADTAIHFAIDDMEIAEDLQMIVAHMTKRWLYNNRQSIRD